MARVFPRIDGKSKRPLPLPPPAGAATEPAAESSECGTVVLTVWKKSSMSFDCMDGFTVYDCKGKLVFRVENYGRSCRLKTRDLVLMDGDGRPLISLKPKMLSMHEQWDGIFGSARTAERRDGKPAFSVRKRRMAQNKGHEALVHLGGNFLVPEFYVEGNYDKRCCTVRCSATEEVAAELRRKQAGYKPEILLGSDVFSLIVHAGFDSELMMALIVALDRISWRPFLPAPVH